MRTGGKVNTSRLCFVTFVVQNMWFCVGFIFYREVRGNSVCLEGGYYLISKIEKFPSFWEGGSKISWLLYLYSCWWICLF